MNTPQPKAYSYIRFSSQAQSSGDSLRRQTIAAQAYAAEHKLTLDTTLSIRDLGVSAFKGKNFAEGALGKFIVAVDEGRVEKGSFLLVEHLDRLSRLPVMDALHIFQEIIRRGICIVTLRDRIVYSQENLNENWTTLIIALATMSGANEASVSKSDRVGKAWQNKKQEARESLKSIGNNAPRWLDYTQDAQVNAYSINEERAAIVRRIFDMSIGGYGKTIIAKTLNTESIPSFNGKTWAVSSLQKLLSNRALLGEYQPHIGRGKERTPVGAPIPGYYPVVISESTFYQAQEAAAGRRVAGATKQTPRFNVWQGIARCGICLGPLHLVNKGKAPKGSTYLHCYAARNGLCKAKAIRLDQSEPVFAELLTKVDSLSLVQDSSADLSKQLSEIEGRLSMQEKKRIELSGAIDANFSQTLVDLLLKCEETIASFNKEKETLLLALASETITNKEDFFARLAEGNVLGSYEGRYRANALLKRLKIKVFIDRVSNSSGVKYMISADGKMLRGIIQDADGTINNSVAFTPEQLEKGKTQDFDGSIESGLSMLLSERESEMMSGKWWDEATLESKIVEMLARTDMPLAKDDPRIQDIKDYLDSEFAKFAIRMEKSLSDGQVWLDTLDE